MNVKRNKGKLLALTLAALVMGGSAVHAVAAQGGKAETKAAPRQLLYKPTVSVAGQEGANFVGVKAVPSQRARGLAENRPRQHAPTRAARVGEGRLQGRGVGFRRRRG